MSRLIKFSDTALNDSDKTLDFSASVGSASASHKYELLYALVRFTTTATVGNRLLTIAVLDETGTELFHTHPGSYQAASLTYHYYLMPGIFRETVSAVTETGVDGTMQMPFPEEMKWNPNWTLRIYDKNAVDAAADDMLISGVVELCHE